jgi:hypothetical protein
MTFLRRILGLLRARVLSPLARRFCGRGALCCAEIPPPPPVAPEHEELLLEMRRRLESGALFQPLLRAAEQGAVIAARYRRDGDDREYRIIAGPEGKE